MLPLLVAAVLALSGCAGGGLSAISPGASGGVVQTITPTPTPTPTPTASPTPAPGAISFGTPVFNPSNDGSGDCSAPSGIELLALGAVATIPISQANHTGSYSASVSDATIISATVSGNSVTVTAVAAGTATFTVSDGARNSSTCTVGVTTANGSVH